MPALFSNITAILKDDYQPPVRKLINNRNILYRKIRRETENYEGGNRAYVPLHVGRNIGIGARAEAVDLPVAGRQIWNNAVWNAKSVYGAIEVSGQAIRNTKAAAFVRILQAELEGLAKDLASDANRYLFHDGSGFLATCGVTATANLVVCNSTKYIKVGQIVDLRAISDGTAAATARTVTAVNSATTFTIDGAAVTTAVTDAVMRTSDRLGATWGVHQMPWGLQALVSASNPGNGLTDLVGGITRVGNTFWQANSVDAGNTTLDIVDHMEQAWDATEIALDTHPGLILTNHARKRAYAKLLVNDKRYPPGGEITLDGGYRALEFNGVPLVADKDATLAEDPLEASFDRMYFLTMSSLQNQLLTDWQWLDDDGDVLKMKTGGAAGTRQDVWQAWMVGEFEISTDRPQTNCLLFNFNDPA